MLWAVRLGVSLKWHFCPAMLIISEDILVTAPSDGAGRKEVCNHVQLVPLHNMIKPFHYANYLFVPIICFAELVNPRVHLDCKSNCCWRTFHSLASYRLDDCLLCFWAQLFCVCWGIIQTLLELFAIQFLKCVEQPETKSTGAITAHTLKETKCT